MTESTTGRRAKLTGLCESIPKADSKNALLDLIDQALGVAAPEGDPVTLESLGKRYREQVDDAGNLYDRVDRVATRGISDVWVGDTSVLAQDAVSAAARAVLQLTEAFQGGARALTVLADAVKDAQKQDGDGRTKLNDARSRLGGRDGFFDDMHEDDGEENDRLTARFIAADGVDLMHKAAVAADDAARAAARDLNKWAAEARAGKLKTDDLTAVDRLMLADTSNVGGDPELNEILTANDLERAGQRMESLPPGERARMERLLADAATPQERAYLMKALAAGYSVKEVEEFGGKIHGRDEEWLREHLAPVTTNSGTGQERQTYGDENWSQDGATCVPSSTVTARAMVDPVYALELTGGPDGTDDSPDAFRERLTDEQMRMHEEGDGSNEGWLWDRKPAGMDSEGQVEISDKELSPHTGDSYDSQDMDGADDRRDVLTDIEKSVAEGKPVPINVEGKDENGDWVGHGMMIVGQEGNMLQVYNPWGTTTWVSEEDFVKGDLSAASDDRFDNVNRVYIEQD
ncbi:peptidoglycan-binding protein [Streptomyces lincolnensis]|uniref:Peptidoglycan binding domain-containing protein n=1 Tax=Streptomyces lincolnensis TaxID=1915 RepID=A0A1B1MBB5_STRLN|nr:peptidoglycan-binding protein [Streptomyces lincolnensis]ANS65925.1 peptidoglycan binding domain-containing protein [Streptomyces lincolnensis]AXG54312.1 peptidoglycan binding domain-containing protein [Streptomyces lincolnensis]QMV08686.1 peptidoglycan-binding protein [Streptomyces lincolnensis]